MRNDELRDANQATNAVIIKRSGKQAEYEPIKIRVAIEKANAEESRASKKLTDDEITAIVDGITADVMRANRAFSVEEIQEKVLDGIFESGKKAIYDLYRDYRNKHLEQRNNPMFQRISGFTNVRVQKDGSVSGTNEDVKEENSNKNPTIVSVQRDYMAGEVSREMSKQIYPADVMKAHAEGIIHFHDTDYAVNLLHNCCLVNLEDMLQNGTVISETMIERPKSFSTACNIATQAIAQIASSQYGGQSYSLTHLAPFVDVSRKKYLDRFSKEWTEAGIQFTGEQLAEVAEKELRKEVEAGCQLMQYQLITLQTTNGQAPFVTAFMYINEAPEGQLRDDLILIITTMLKQRIYGIKDVNGNLVTPAFPKLIYVLQENNITEGSPYWEVTKLAAKCTAKRMVPDYISEKKMKELKGGDVYVCMGCRSFLTPDRFTDAGIGNIEHRKNYKEGEHRYYGRFNQGVITLNLVDVACSSNKDETKFWEILNDRLELCHRGLRARHEHLLGTPSDVAPILWQHGALARLQPGEPIDELLYHGYSTISLGYAGLAETVYYMKGKSHTSEEGKEFGLKVMQALNDACAKWKKAEDIDYSVYGTPLESTTYKFAKALQRRFGVIEGVSDHNYITNSYHINVREEISAFDKLKKEAEFQVLSPGGAISYVEVPDMQNNIEGILSIMQYMYDTILYAEINSKSDICECCGYTGEIQIVEDTNKKLIWECPNCGNRNQDKMYVARRTCGYIGTQFWNQGRTQEIKDRVLHVATTK